MQKIWLCLSYYCYNDLKLSSCIELEKKSVSGNKIVTPTADEVILQKNETKASSTESSLSDDKVSAQKGALDAVETDAKAATTDAKAMDTGASALKTKAGATDIGTKVLKLN